MIPSMFCRSRHDVSPIKSRSVPTKYVRSHDVFRTTYEMSDLIRIRIGSEGATDSSKVDCKTVGFFLKISKEIGKAWRESLTRAKRASLTNLTRP